MKFRLSLAIAVAIVCLFAQGQSAQQPPQGITIEGGVAQATAGQPVPLTPSSVVATIDGKPVTAGELEGVLRGLPPQTLQMAMQNPNALLQQYGMLKKLSEQAEQNKLHERSPLKESLVSSRMQLLYQAQVQNIYEQIAISPEEQKKYYDSHQDRYSQARVKVIYIPFSNDDSAKSEPDSKKTLTEAEAKTKAESIVKEARSGADFVKLVKEHSEDPGSAQNNGDFPPITRADGIPENIKNAVFALKKGEISDPVPAASGFYIFRAEEMIAKSLDEVRIEIANELKMARLKERLDGIQKGIEVKIENPAYFQRAPTPVPTGQ